MEYLLCGALAFTFLIWLCKYLLGDVVRDIQEIADEVRRIQKMREDERVRILQKEASERARIRMQSRKIKALGNYMVSKQNGVNGQTEHEIEIPEIAENDDTKNAA